MARTDMWRSAGLSLLAIVFGILASEGVLRVLSRPHPDCYGVLLGVALPPCSLPSPYTPLQSAVDRDEPYEDVVVGGKRITVGDLSGIARHDSVIGYAPESNVTSVNGWWRTDELGARIGSKTDVENAGAKRLLVLGDSYAVGSRLPFEETWSFVLDTLTSALDVINFGMDGYGMAQAYLRYQAVREHVEHDMVLLMFVPEQDLWRDVGVRRDVGGDWPMYWVLPRFIASDDSLRLIENPFPLADSTAQKASSPVHRGLKDHLRAFDRLYRESWYDEATGLEHLVVVKLGSAVIHKFWRAQLLNRLQEHDSEAVRVSALIFRTLRDEVTESGKTFVLTVLPTERALESGDDEFWREWKRVVRRVCVGDLSCIDLADALRRLPRSMIDHGYDDSHLGPIVNREIARILADSLVPIARTSTK